MKWKVKSFSELTTNELYELLKARVDVFVVEQDCPYPELDNYDQEAMHYFLKINEEIAANVRILPAGSKFENVSIGRVLVTGKFRGNGYAKQLMQKAIAYSVEQWHAPTIQIQGQEYLKKFYTELGFRQVSASYMEDGIPHIDMIWEQN
ncbi:GNAT family N-acetyltransferase [Virgibacillus ihumii]|uniref:GNAT family N-acetyltransferase n=1 Tax=Virgibacillus ihumii TaxID=2686091 RepID=UPI00157D3BC2|nr:GNAT family N-acetyltransferase [Virgibacillus ihumii]